MKIFYKWGLLAGGIGIVAIVGYILYNVVVVGAGLFTFFFTIFFSPTPENRAEKEMKPILANLSVLNPQAICDNGDPGRGFDNIIPWYELYLSVDSENVDNIVKDAASNAGYILEIDQQYIKIISRPDPIYDKTEFNPAASYLKARKDDKSIRITIVPSGEIALKCRSKYEYRYGQKMSPSPGKSILKLELSLPSGSALSK